MPTGYTLKLMEEGQTFPEFAMTCARAFGALIEMRDEPLDKPIPENLDGFDDGYHAKAIKEAKVELKRLEEMSKSERGKLGHKLKRDYEKSLRESLGKHRLEQHRLANMRKEVAAWTPPTPEHEGMKKFMLEQIDLCRQDNDYYDRELKACSLKSSLTYVAEAMEAAKRSIVYHTKAQAKESERNRGRNEWIVALRNSLK